MNVTELLAGVGLGGFRSFQEMQYLGPLTKVNLIAGQNNAGKSNILRFVSRFLHANPEAPEVLDHPSGVPGQLLLAIARQTPDFDYLFTRSGGRVDAGAASALLSQLLKDPAIHPTGDDELLWFKYVRSPDKGTNTWTMDPDQVAAISANVDQRQLAEVVLSIFSRAGGALENVSAILTELSPMTKLPPTEFIEAFRQIRSPSSDNSEQPLHNGEGLIRRLQRLERPEIGNLADGAKFEAINQFLRNVLDDQSAELQIPSTASTIHVKRGEFVLPLENLGTGVHQVVILAAAATLLENTLVLVEEPEVNLHPLLQRKLVRYLTLETSNQYLIATHSAHMLDYERATVFHAQHKANGTEIQRTGTPQQLSDLCADLGYRPSDLLQANAVIWVEGPSDRLYLKKWISMVDGDLIEGIHYSIMFYGGRLLNHLSAHDPDVREFISLRRLNRHCAILIDSDKTKPQGRINATKIRVSREFEDKLFPGHAWITDGRTIENYVPLGVLKQAMADVHPGRELTYAGGKWEDPLKNDQEGKSVDKVRIAKTCCEALQEENLDHRDLRMQVSKIVAFIRTANGI